MSTADADVALWLSWKRVAEVTRARVLADVLAASALTEPELTVLALLDETDGTLRQNALATAAGWDRTRLSHLLTRMERRGHVTRRRLRNGVEVTVTPTGAAALRSTRRPLRVAVRQHITSRLDAEQRAAMQTVVDALRD